MGPPARPASSLSRNGSQGSRPGTSDGTFARTNLRPVSPVKRALASAKPTSKTSTGGFGFVTNGANGRSVSTTSNTNLQKSRVAAPPLPRSPSPPKYHTKTPQSNDHPATRPFTGSKTISVKPSRARPALGDAFEPRPGHATTRSPVKAEASASPVAPQSSKRAVSNPLNTSSAALRQQIAAAKAAARKDKIKDDTTQGSPSTNGNTSSTDMILDPFNQAPKDGKHILRNRIKAARQDGRLNVAAMGLKHIPEEVLTMYSASVMEADNVSWAELVDLTRFIAADNELEELGDNIFPDVTADELAADDHSNGNQFGGLEMLDLHGNTLQAVPLGLRRLERLTSLNLSHNKLDNAAMEVVSQIQSLKELKLGTNALSGNLPTSLCQLKQLETLDLQCNRLLGLPEALRELVGLRVLNIAGNQLTALPMEAIQQLPLTELDASNNALIGSLFPLGGDSAHPTLQSLSVAHNSLAALTFSESLNLPQLRSLDVTNNHFTVLPPIQGWSELVTLVAADNKISELPEGLTTLQKLRNVNFTSNELRLLDPQIARMESLESLILASNPLRDKKYLTMSAGDVKRDLKTRLEPDEPRVDDVSDPETVVDVSSNGVTTMASTKTRWQLKVNGMLDLGGQLLTDGVNDLLGSFLKSNEVRELNLSANKLTAVPPALWLGQNIRLLDLSGNSLGSEYLYDELELPALKELNLSKCSLTSLEPLTSQLSAPALQVVNVTANRLTGAVPTLRIAYPALTMLLAGDNKFTSVTADALRGLHAVNLASNDIDGLPAEIGLLWDVGLRSFEIGSNAFRVPNYRILEKGTEATMRWLRDKLPAGEGVQTNGGAHDDWD